MKLNELLLFKQMFQDYYNDRFKLSFEDEKAAANMLQLQTETQHSISMIFLAGWVAKRATIHNNDYAKCQSIGCQFYDTKMEFNCSANENLCEKCMNNQKIRV